MKKVMSIIFTVLLASSILGGCYSKACEQPQPVQSSPSLKGEG